MKSDIEAANNPANVEQADLHRWLGASPLRDGSARFCVWAPLRSRLDVVFPQSDRVEPLHKRDGGYHVAEVPEVPVGTEYLIRIEGGSCRPDPASRFQPHGVHGPSQVISPDFAWTDQAWSGVGSRDLVIYELHMGTFTDAGTYAAAIDRLDELVELGITAVELMPVADSPGRWNWGYDGVHLFAPRPSYGEPESLRQFVNAAHQKGLSVILDVVYNHLGPEGNYLGDYGAYLSQRHHTVWGAAPNFDDPDHGRELRRFIISNALHWYDEYHIDALRIDAIHCMLDESEPHIVSELGAAVGAWAANASRPAMLIAESNVYDPQLLQPVSQGGSGFDAEWCDDFLHSVFATVRPGEQLSDRAYQPGHDLNQVLQTGFVYEGTLRRPRERRPRGPRVCTHGLIYSIQNHDFIGNHPLGKRFHQVTSRETQLAAAALLMLNPAIPMLFMGEEFACEQPFRFFVDFSDPALRQAVVTGRMNEYPQHDWSGGISPVAEEAFSSSRIGPAGRGDPTVRDWYRRMVMLRREWRSKDLLSDEHLAVESNVDQGLFVLKYQSPRAAGLLAVRLCPMEAAGEDAVELPSLDAGWKLIADSRPQDLSTDCLLPNHAKIFEK